MFVPCFGMCITLLSHINFQLFIVAVHQVSSPSAAVTCLNVTFQRNKLFQSSGQLNWLKWTLKWCRRRYVLVIYNGLRMFGQWQLQDAGWGEYDSVEPVGGADSQELPFPGLTSRICENNMDTDSGLISACGQAAVDMISTWRGKWKSLIVYRSKC